MAQLRDAQTSEFLHQGSPTEMVLLAERLGRDQVIFDDVGLSFDPDAVLAEYKAELSGLKLAARDPGTPYVTEDHVAGLLSLERAADNKVSEVKQSMREARERSEKA